MIKKRILVALMAILVISVGLVACGPEEPSKPEPTTTLSVSEPEVKPQEPVAEPEITPEPEPEPEVAPEPEPVVEPEVIPEPEPEVTSEPEVPETQVAEPVTAVSITAKVSGKHTVGETLSAADFTITVNMSDGSTIKNPAGWNANPLTLSSESTVITVTYNGLSTTVTVNASQPVTQQPVVQQPEPQPEPSVGEPPLPENAWPSTWNQITYQARDDLYNYAIARGWYSSIEGSGSYSSPCVRKGEYVIVFEPDLGGFLAYGLENCATIECPVASLAGAYTFIDTH